jgi:hypothetical protein
MTVKKSAKQKNTRHHFATTPAISKKKSKKAKLRNNDLRSQLDGITGLSGASTLFKPHPTKVAPPKAKVDEKKMEDDMIALLSMKL